LETKTRNQFYEKGLSLERAVKIQTNVGKKKGEGSVSLGKGNSKEWGDFSKSGIHVRTREKEWQRFKKEGGVESETVLRKPVGSRGGKKGRAKHKGRGRENFLGPNRKRRKEAGKEREQPNHRKERARGDSGNLKDL